MKRFKWLILIACLFTAITFSACGNENKNVLSTPKGVTVETGGIVIFERVNNEGYYVINIDELEITVFPRTHEQNPNVDLYNENGVDYLAYDASKVLTLGESYTIKVKAGKDKKKDSAYSTAISYTHTLPIDKPTNVQINGTTLTWDDVESASIYRVKVVTPTDNISADDSATIASLDLSSYQFSNNQFNFASILTDVGVYKFYVNAISYNKDFTESEYTTKVTYTHTQTLNTPSSVIIHKLSELDASSGKYVDNLHLVAVIDNNTNAVTITSGSNSHTEELNSINNAFSIDNNVIDVNLNKFFNTNFDNLTQYEFTIQANFITPNANEKYYIDSSVSNKVYFANTSRAEAPTVSITYDSKNMVNIMTWSEDLTLNISGYALYLYTADGVTIENVGVDATSRVIDEEIIAVGVQALGKGSYLTSAMSDIVSLTQTEQTKSLEFTTSSSIISWTDMNADYYILEIDDQVFTSDNNYLDISTLNLTLGEKELKVVSIAEGFKPSVATYKFKYSITLAKPTRVEFASSNPYLLTFNSVDNAIGYYVYLNNERIDKVFTSTAIDLSNYIIKSGEYSDYTVTVQAIADKYSGYEDSAITSGVVVSHIKVLDSVIFKKDNSGVEAPIEKRNVNGEKRYYLCFYGVQYAVSYEVMINFNSISVTSDNRSGLYEIDITDYLSSANSYTITVRALPNSNNSNIRPSVKSSYDYVLRLQLNQVTNIQYAMTEGVYTLSFDLQDNAKEYSVRIVKVNDYNYEEYLYNLGLSNVFTTIGATDITKYITEAGLYQIYVTAIADISGGYYADSDESSEYAKINKLTTLDIPSEIEYNDYSANQYWIRWNGDDNADYYIIRVTNPNGVVKEYKTANNNVYYNINDSVTIEGQYSVKVKSMITPNSDNSKTYQSSSYCDLYYINYNYINDYDFMRYSVFMNGATYDFYIENVTDLMYILWYHMLYGVEVNGLQLYIALNDDESVDEALTRLATEANNAGLYNFDTDADYQAAIAGGQGETFKYIVNKLLELYPELSVLQGLTCTHDLDSQIFTLKYTNALNVVKVDAGEAYTYFATDYGNKYTYLSESARRRANSLFAIDMLDSVNVTTTEQLLMAVQYGKRPNFVGDSTVAELVYESARAVLRAIANDTMTDYEKTVAIFDWLEYAINLNHYANKVTTHEGIVNGSLAEYGMRMDYYLEGIFLNLNNADANGYDNEFYLGNVAGTSESYAKAFTLLCAIEGISSRKINGTYTYSYDYRDYDIAHAWNKVYLDLTDDDTDNFEWYALDLMFSDNYYLAYNHRNSYGISSHAYFLVTDQYLQTRLNLSENGVGETIVANTTFDYYSNATFALTRTELSSLIGSNMLDGVDSYIYDKKYNETEEYQLYSGLNFGNLQAYVANAILYADYQLNFINANKFASFEIKVDKSYTNNLPNLGNSFGQLITNVNSIIQEFTYYTSMVKVIAIEDGEGGVTYICTMKSLY